MALSFGTRIEWALVLIVLKLLLRFSHKTFLNTVQHRASNLSMPRQALRLP